MGINSFKPLLKWMELAGNFLKYVFLHSSVESTYTAKETLSQNVSYSCTNIFPFTSLCQHSGGSGDS